MIKFISIAIAMILSAASALAASPADVDKVVRHMVAHDASKRLLDWRRYPDGVNETRVVFVHKGVKYTLFYGGDAWKFSDGTIKPQAREEFLLSVWARPIGSTGRKSLLAMQDDAVDGVLDAGSLGDNSRGYNNGQFTARLYKTTAKPEGVERQSYWQNQYDAAIKAALEFYSTR